MDQNLKKEIVSCLGQADQDLAKIAQCMSVLKVLAIAGAIGFLIVVLGS